jgi:peptidoglycan-N-acetylglucosamine deacetylase
MYLHKTPFILKKLYPSLIWNNSRLEKKIYLTFDDGPIPEVTDFVLETLGEFGAMGTFFCVGDNIRKHPEVFQRVVTADHSVGNHTFNHLNGFKNSNENYFSNIQECDSYINNAENKSNLFRPPYGRIRNSQIQVLKKNYKIIMWDVLSGDFDKSLAPDKCLKETIRCTKPGSIVVFHDSVKTYDTIKYVLPRYLYHFRSLGFSFKRLVG